MKPESPSDDISSAHKRIARVSDAFITRIPHIKLALGADRLTVACADTIMDIACMSTRPGMKNSESTEIVLRRCKIMNCILEGQSFSLGILDTELGNRQTVEATMRTMSAAGLVKGGRNGTYVITGPGAAAIMGMAPIQKPGYARGSGWQPRNKSEVKN